MRRPTPLPQAPRADASAAPPRRSRDEVAFGDDGDVDETAVEPDALPIAAAFAAPSAAAPSPGEDVATGPDDADPFVDASAQGPGPLRARDVWAAARARRKALRAEVRRFTARQRRRRMMWLGALGAVVLLVLGTLAAAYGPLFAVERVEVVGTATLDPAAVEQALAGQIGTPLPLVDSSAVKAALVAFPLVESYTLEARPPHDLVVRIVERTPVGVFENAAGFTLVDAAGVALSTTPDRPEGVPLIAVDGGPRSAAFEAAGHVYRSLPDDVRARVSDISATSPNDVTLTLGDTGAQVVWGNADDSAEKAVRLGKIMAARPDASLYDVSSPDAIVVR
ncbi:FtsQ-type POTRA domain-containing protein [Microbacterium telephonicum]|uniref:Cell division protein FtsQ n=1 Tax=Microbacterium telephonicum TaxID=1714841 RepID=A0A498C1C2_9MICO|nr:FtsQ-type POTRA domain-containing protein [Microbacterium telephonicum]RLK49654.1 cell division protein FtsQ [Microbacterium telephonicum]